MRQLFNSLMSTEAHIYIYVLESCTFSRFMRKQKDKSLFDYPKWNWQINVDILCILLDIDWFRWSLFGYVRDHITKDYMTTS